MPAGEAAVVATNAQSNARYEILRVVNRGGMGEIALGRVKGTKGFEKLVVLKRLRADAERPDHRAMFDVEAELMSRIEHPNIVQVFDQPIIDNVSYLAMGYVRGRNLDQLIRKMRSEGGDIPAVFALTVIHETLRGLAFIHRLKDDNGRALGVVHQDVTPSNILVSFFGEVKITDFGIAYVTSRDGGLRKGVLKGKPRYVAPEVLAGRRVNNRVDIYGTAVVLYELLKGRALFGRKKVEATLTAVAKNEIPDFAIDLPNIPEGVHDILRKALSKDPQDRFRTAEEMSSAVTAELAALGGPMSPTRIGAFLREQFRGDQDVPDIQDDDVHTATLSIFPPAFSSPDLDQTLSELDRLLGSESSSDLYALPPEIANELAEIEDMEPFEALTPIPELALSGPNGEELLLSASLAGLPPPMFDSKPIRTDDHRLPPQDFAMADEHTERIDPPANLRPGGLEETGEYLAPRAASFLGGATGEYSFSKAAGAEIRREITNSALPAVQDEHIAAEEKTPARAESQEALESALEEVTERKDVEPELLEAANDHSSPKLEAPAAEPAESEPEEEVAEAAPEPEPEPVEEAMVTAQPSVPPPAAIPTRKMVYFGIGLIAGVLVGGVVTAFIVLRMLS